MLQQLVLGESWGIIMVVVRGSRGRSSVSFWCGLGEGGEVREFEFTAAMPLVPDDNGWRCRRQDRVRTRERQDPHVPPHARDELTWEVLVVLVVAQEACGVLRHHPISFPNSSATSSTSTAAWCVSVPPPPFCPAFVAA